MMEKNKEKRKFIRVGIKQLTSIIKNHGGGYELVEESTKPTPALINVKDISTGGLRIESKHEIKKGAFLELTIPKIKALNSANITCEVTRSQFKDGEYYHDIGLRFRPANTEDLQQLLKLIKTDLI